MLIERCRLECLFCLRADNERYNVPAAVFYISINRLVESNHQQSVLPEGWACDQRIDVGLKPLIGSRQLVIGRATRNRGWTVMRVVVLIGNDERVIWQLVVGQIDREL